MGLTFRQKALLAEFIDFFEEEKKPIHYIAVAKRLGLSNTAAYEMLRRLEQTGAVEGVYVSSEDPVKKGRAKVLFIPGKKTIDVVHQLEKEDPQGKIWNEVKYEIIQHIETGNHIYPDDQNDLQIFLDKILANQENQNEYSSSDQLSEFKDYIMARISRGKSAREKQVVNDLLGMLSNESSPVLCCAQIFAILMLSIKRSFGQVRDNLQETFLIISDTPKNKEGLSLLAGMMIGSHFSGGTTILEMRYYHRCSNLFYANLINLSNDDILKLHEFITVLWKAIFSNPAN